MKWLLGFSVICLSVLFAELMSRNIEKGYFIDTNLYIQGAKPKLHRLSRIPGLSYELVPNTKTPDGFFRVNSRGIRDKEYGSPKPEGVYRIIILGDSVTFGTEYRVEETYPKILESILSSNLIFPYKFEVLNAGVCGYNALQKFIFFKNKLLTYQPDLVIFQFLNDDYYRNAVVIPDNSYYTGQKVKKFSLGEYFAANFPAIIPLPERFNTYLFRYCALYRLINKTLYDWLSFKNPGRYPINAYRFAGYKNMSDSMRLNKEVFGKFFTFSRENNFQFVLLLVPELVNQDNMDPWIKGQCPDKFGFKVIELFDEFKRRGIDLVTLRIYPKGLCHFNKTGHAYTAQIISEWLKANVLIKLKAAAVTKN